MIANSQLVNAPCTCRKCGKEFTQTTRGRKRHYCSDECRPMKIAGRRGKKPGPPVPCKQCGCLMPRSLKRSFCSPECKQAGTGQKFDCKKCGKKCNRAKNGRKARQFCGSECYFKWSGDNRHKQTCCQCGEQFIRTNSRNRQENVYCSHACAQSASQKLPRIECKCEACGKEWVSAKERTVCSQQCMIQLDWGDRPIVFRRSIGQQMVRFCKRSVEQDKITQAINSRLRGLHQRSQMPAGRQKQKKARVGVFDAISHEIKRMQHKEKRAGMSPVERKCDSVCRNLRRRASLRMRSTTNTTSSNTVAS